MAIAGRRPRRERRIGRPTGGFGYNYVNPQFSTNTLLGPTGSPILDDFNNGPSQSLSTRAGWANSVRAQGFGDFITDTGPTVAVCGSQADNLWGTPMLNPEVWMTIADWPGLSGSFFLFARWTTAATQNGYLCHVFSGTFLIQMITGGTPITTLMNIGISLAPGDSFGMNIIGSTINGYTKIGSGSWTLAGTAVDTTYPASGNIAMTADQPGNNVNTFGGSDTIIPSRSELIVVRRTWAGR